MKHISLKPLNGPRVRRTQLAPRRGRVPAFYPALGSWAHFSHDGTRLYVGGGVGTIDVWDTSSFKPLGTIITGVRWLDNADLHPTLLRLASGGADGVIRVWDLDSGKTLLRVAVHRKAVNAVRFSPDGGRLISGSDDGTVREINAVSGQRVGRLKRLHTAVHALAVSPDGTYVGALHRTGIRVWDQGLMDVLRVSATYGHGGENQSGLAFSRDSRRLWVTFSGHGQGVRVWDLTRLNFSPQAAPIRHRRDSALSLSMSPDGRLAAIGSIGRVLLAREKSFEFAAGWDAGKPGRRGIPSQTRALCFSPDCRLLVSAHYDGDAWVWPVPAT